MLEQKETAMTRKLNRSISELMNDQGANALLSATLSFLLSHNVSKGLILKSVRNHCSTNKTTGNAGELQKLLRAYEDMGMIMSTWYSEPKFLDSFGKPLPLALRRSPGVCSVLDLVRVARVRTSAALATDLMHRSPSIKLDGGGNFLAVRRVFVLPEFEIPRAALVIERYLDTLRRNASAHKRGTTLLLERNCHVQEVDLQRVAPILRDIKSRGTAFMDSIDGEIEAHRLSKARQKRVGELGVLIFAWTQSSNRRKSKIKL